MTTPERLTPVLDAALDGTGLLLDTVTVSPAGKRRVVRVVVDHVLQDEGITDWPTDPLSLDEVADVTHAINAALDAGDVMGEAPYTLEVTSPGVTRPLTERRHFRRNVGRLICIVGAGETVTGRLLRVTDDAHAHPGGIEGWDDDGRPERRGRLCRGVGVVYREGNAPV